MLQAHKSVLFVCTGNICRSPTAEGILRARLSELGRLDEYRIDSAATHSWNVGCPPDDRSAAVARANGVSLDGMRARRIRPSDFREFSVMLAMDKGHLQTLRAHRPDDNPPEIRLFLDLYPGHEGQDVPDPYYGDMPGFHHVYDLINRGVEAILQSLKRPWN
ncbi:MAG: low molecular weight phosphotyrosine protein phosphatase [Alphaproteobacteria bacterium]|nr:low molecular weight phosphotyrosine protein phosphatase [Alphaproteobacteria bacterium]MCB9974006.1 low molecular weight phosphotyrosine protein phosphatase [Rhodospirillales bacterium]